METHLDSTVDERKLALNGYSSMKNNHPQNVKRGGAGLYVKESFPAKNRSDLETLPECIVCEIQLNGKKYFFAVLYRSPSQTSAEFEDFTNNFELIWKTTLIMKRVKFLNHSLLILVCTS